MLKEGAKRPRAPSARKKKEPRAEGAGIEVSSEEGAVKNYHVS